MNVLFSVPRLHMNYTGMIEGLINAGHNVSFIALNGGSVHIPFDFDIKVYHFKAPQRSYIPDERKKQLFLPSFSKLKQILKETKPDLIIARDILGMNVQLSVLARMSNIRILFYDQSMPFTTDNFRRKIYRLLARTLIANTRITTVNSNGYQGSFAKNTHFVPFPVSLIDVPERIPRTVNSGKLKIMVIGKLDRTRKNLKFCIEALLPLLKENKVELSIYGIFASGNTEHPIYLALKEYIDENDLWNAITIHGNEKYEIVRQAYFEHDVFILPSLNELAAISHFEAMSSAMPVIVTKENGTNYVIEEGENGFTFDPRDNNDLLKKVNFFIEHPEKIAEFGKHAYQRISQNYTPSVFAENIGKIAWEK